MPKCIIHRSSPALDEEMTPDSTDRITVNSAVLKPSHTFSEKLSQQVQSIIYIPTCVAMEYVYFIATKCVQQVDLRFMNYFVSAAIFKPLRKGRREELFEWSLNNNADVRAADRIQLLVENWMKTLFAV
jgi:hypothetical protein